MSSTVAVLLSPDWRNDGDVIGDGGADLRHQSNCGACQSCWTGWSGPRTAGSTTGLYKNTILTASSSQLHCRLLKTGSPPGGTTSQSGSYYIVTMAGVSGGGLVHPSSSPDRAFRSLMYGLSLRMRSIRCFWSGKMS